MSANKKRLEEEEREERRERVQRYFCVVIIGFQKIVQKYFSVVIIGFQKNSQILILLFSTEGRGTITTTIITAVSPRGAGRRKSSNDDEALAPGS